MQTPNWYISRLRSMSPQEVAWRINSKLRDVVDRLRFAVRLYPSAHYSQPEFRRGFTCVPTSSDFYPEHWRANLLTRAEHIRKGRFTYFNLEDVFHGSPVDWNRDHSVGRQTPLTFAPAIDYRDFRRVGDCKLVWEPNRHHHLVVLARAYAVTGDERFARAVVEQMTSWLDACVFGRGMNWRSPLELGIRVINWVWALDLIHDSGLFTGQFRDRVLHSIHLHLWEITRKYSRYSSANNHLIGEAAGVYVATTYFHFLPNAAKWRLEAREILERELLIQTYSDGCTREQALGYEMFVLQFYLIAGSVARATEDELPPTFWSRLEKMLEFVSAIAQGGPPPLFGDCDDGYVLDLGSGPCNYIDVLAVGSALLDRPDLRINADNPVEALRWLPLPLETPARSDSFTSELQSRSFSESGYYLLQSGTGDERVSVIFDCGELGFGPIAAHGHADALSIMLRAFGGDVLVDPGTHDYFSFPGWRRYFRSSRAHNTMVIDGVDQSEMAGLFLWGSRATARCIDFAPTHDGGMVCGEHDGYRRLVKPCIHRRTVELHGSELSLRDEIKGGGAHKLEVFFHLAENCSATRSSDTEVEIVANGGTVFLQMDWRFEIEILRGSDEPKGGWVSRRYHGKSPSTTIVGRADTVSDASFLCEMKVVPSSKTPISSVASSVGKRG